ncbi:MAG TPA: hypothetical protein VJS91_04935 [Nitrososphaeraceae archaeon]|nr:hypothetical protein [Nitrososphaeraceae archaeon]
MSDDLLIAIILTGITIIIVIIFIPYFNDQRCNEDYCNLTLKKLGVINNTINEK